MGQQISEQNAVVEAGDLQTPDYAIPLRVAGQFSSVDDLAHMPIRAGGLQLRLGDLGEIRRGTVDPPTPKVRLNGQQVVALGVSMQKGGNIILLGKSLTEADAQIRTQLPLGVEFQQIQDQPAVVGASVSEFLIVLAEAI
ncbi:MAG: efflux RND transporter permease subunit, partial [bacterium]